MSQRICLIRGGSLLSNLDQVVLALGHGPLIAWATELAHAEFAARHGLSHIGPANPADVDLDALRPGTPVAVRDLGLCFFDYLTSLTAGRGGRSAAAPARRPPRSSWHGRCVASRKACCSTGSA